MLIKTLEHILEKIFYYYIQVPQHRLNKQKFKIVNSIVYVRTLK